MTDVSAKPLTLMERLEGLIDSHDPRWTQGVERSEEMVREWADEALSVEKIAKLICSEGDASEPNTDRAEYVEAYWRLYTPEAEAVVALLRREIGVTE